MEMEFTATEAFSIASSHHKRDKLKTNYTNKRAEIAHLWEENRKKINFLLKSMNHSFDIFYWKIQH